MDEISFFFILGNIGFIPDAICTLLWSRRWEKNLETTAVNPDGSVVTVMLNETEVPIRFEIRIGSQTAQMDAPERFIQTVVVKP